MQGTLEIDANLWNELHALVEEIHTSPNPHQFKDTLDPACSFHIQQEEPTKVQAKAPALIPCQQDKLNATSNILKFLNPAKGLFNQLTACTLALSTCFQANSVPSAFHT
ncbi:hypothetical protein C0989_007448 [Termitomyces sp. Mn162]|nr:hypothetical protein C0989_007448 [Termitomyces sp. Mn162]